MTEAHFSPAHNKWINTKVALLFDYAVEHQPLTDNDYEWLTEKIDAIMANIEKQAKDIATVDTDRYILMNTLETIQRADEGRKTHEKNL